MVQSFGVAQFLLYRQQQHHQQQPKEIAYDTENYSNVQQFGFV